MASIGAKHAALMHAKGAAFDPNAWTPQDWELHMAEEEQFLFPLLEQKYADQLASDHAIFRRQLAQCKAIDPARIVPHADLEEVLVERMIGTCG